MKPDFSGAEYLHRKLGECLEGIDEIAQLVREDQWRRDDDLETPFLAPGAIGNLMGAIRQLSDQASTIGGHLEELAEHRRGHR